MNIQTGLESERSVIPWGTCHKDTDACSDVTTCDPCNLFSGTCRSLFKVGSARDAILYDAKMSVEMSNKCQVREGIMHNVRVQS